MVVAEWVHGVPRWIHEPTNGAVLPAELEEEGKDESLCDTEHGPSRMREEPVSMPRAGEQARK
jgi:hypothetical protein